MPNPFYLNPETALPGPDAYKSDLPFGMSMQTPLGMQAAANRRQTMAPFLQNAMQGENMSLAEQATKLKEFQSPEFTQARFAAQKASTAKSGFEAADFARQEAMIPAKTEEEKLQVAQHILQLKDAPRMDMVNTMAKYAQAMKEAKSLEEQQRIHTEALNDFASRYSDRPDLLKQMEQANPEMYKHMQSAAVYTAKYLQEQGLEQTKQEGATKRTELEQAGAGARTTAQIEGKANAVVRFNQIIRQQSQLNTNDPKQAQLEQERQDVGRQVIQDQVDRESGQFKPQLTGIAQLDNPKLQQWQDFRSRRTLDLFVSRRIRPTIAELRELTGSKLPDDQIKQIWNSDHPDLKI